MDRKQFSALLAAVIGLGLAGGLVSWVFIGHSASAQKRSES
ncbi:MAG: hypothetical protein MPW16_21065 (plasmid) [Candidatus Manganitrophus sp.]|nr:MAG: hypothetical protein MPW16_21065 [Candidatus Manganitrophus sp.]